VEREWGKRDVSRPKVWMSGDEEVGKRSGRKGDVGMKMNEILIFILCIMVKMHVDVKSCVKGIHF
jgi:hypothetical protein